MTNEQNNEEQECSVFITTNDPTKVRVTKEIAIPCPSCDKDITLDDIKALCPSNVGKQKRTGKQIKKTVKTKKGTKEVNIDELISWEEWIQDGITCLNKYRKRVGINTCVAKAHFLAQLALESDFYRTKENLNYKTAILTEKFPAFGKGTKFKFSIKVDGKEEYNEVEKNGIQVASEWGRPNGADATTPGVVSSANQINIANWAYQKKNGNRGFASGDGYKYRGRGFIQLTGRSNYIEMTETFNDLVQAINDGNNKNGKSIENETDVDWFNNPDNLRFNARDAMSASLAFWSKNDISKLAIYNSAKCVKVVTSKINVALDNLDKRIVFFKQAVDILQVNECQKELWSNSLPADRKGTLVVVSGIGSKEIKGWVIYETSVYKHTSLERYKQAKQDGTELKADKTFYLARDAHGKREKSNKFRYDYNNEAPPGEYYLISNLVKKLKNPYMLYLYISDSIHTKTVTVIIPPENENNSVEQKDVLAGSAKDKKTKNATEKPKKIQRTLCIQYGDPATALGDLISLDNKSIVDELINYIPDSYAANGRMRIIIEEREVEESSWSKAKKGGKEIINKWTGVLPTPKAPDTAQTL